MAKPISKNVNMLLGLNNALSPSSPAYKEGLAIVSDNSRIDKEGVWNKGPSLGDASTPPTVATLPSGTGSHFQEVTFDNGTVSGQRIVDGLADGDTLAIGGNGYGYHQISGVPKYWTGQDGTGGGTAGLTPPTSPTVTAPTAKGARQDEGLYYYIFTAYNTARKVESLPSNAIEVWVRKYYNENDVRQNDVPKIKATSTGNTIRIYRSLRIDVKKGDTMQVGQEHSPTRFYYVGEVATATDFSDYAHDREIESPENLFTGRGSKPPQTGVDAVASFQNRMFYFKDDEVFWSSAGRPEEVPQSYTLTISQTYSLGTWDDEVLGTGSGSKAILQKPLLDTGLYAEARMRVPELLGKTVVRATEIGDKLWVWTANMTGYIVSSAKYEGFRFIKVRDGVGLCSPWTLVECPYGIFGADKKGIWRIKENYPNRISEGIIDIEDSSKSTYIATAQLAESFGVWVDELKEYLWSFNKRYETNGDFDTDSDWTEGSEWNWTDDDFWMSWVEDGEAGSNKIVSQEIDITAGKTYRVVYTLVVETAFGTAGGMTPILGGTSGTKRTAGGTYTEDIVAGSDDSLIAFLAADGTGYDEEEPPRCYIDSVEVYESYQIAYQADSGVFVGPYNLSMDGGTSFVTSGGYQCYLTSAKTPVLSTRTGLQSLKFWLGQESLPSVKDRVKVEIIYSSITADKDVTAQSYQNNIASETGAATVGDWTHDDDNLVGVIQPVSSGRFFEVVLSIPSDCIAPITSLNYIANLVSEFEKANR